MEEFLVRLADSSIVSGVVILAVLVLRPFTVKLPKWVNLVLWLIVAVRLVMPSGLESSFSLIPDIGVINAQYTELLQGKNDEVTESSNYSDPVIFTEKNDIDATEIGRADRLSDTETDTLRTKKISSDQGTTIDSYPKQVAECETLSKEVDVVRILCIIWIIGFSSLLFYFLLSMLKISHRVRISIPYDASEEIKRMSFASIYVCENIRTPFILGIFKAKLYIPENMDQNTLRYVIRHENAHIRHFDQLLKIVGFLFLTVYWFNPLVWVAFICFSGDIELACDERAVMDMLPKERAGYSMAMLKCSVHKRLINVCPVAFGETGIKTRVKAVIKMKKPLKSVIILTSLGCLGFALCFLTNPVSAETVKGNISAEVYDNKEKPDSEMTAIEMESVKENVDEENNSAVSEESIKPEDDIKTGDGTKTEENTKIEGNIKPENGIKTEESIKKEDINKTGDSIKQENSNKTGDGTINEDNVITNDNSKTEDKMGGLNQEKTEKKNKESKEKDTEEKYTKEEKEYSSEQGKKKNDNKSAVMPLGIREIDEKAFYNKDSIETVLVPDSVKVIGRAAFCDCDNLQGIILPESVEIIGDRSFSFCNHLSTIDFPDSLKEIGQNAFSYCDLRKIVIPRNVVRIGEGAFSENVNLTEVQFKNGISEIPASLFRRDISLTSLNLPKTVKKIGEGAFSCTGLREFKIPDGVEIINASTFSSCSDLESVYIPETVKIIGDGAFADCTKLKNINIPDSVTEIASNAFWQCNSLLEETKTQIRSVNKKVRFDYTK